MTIALLINNSSRVSPAERSHISELEKLIVSLATNLNLVFPPQTLRSRPRLSLTVAYFKASASPYLKVPIIESDARQHGIYLFYIIAKSLFCFKMFQHYAKAGLLPSLCPAFARKKPFDVIYDPYKMKQFHWLLCVAENCDWSRKIMPTAKPDASVAPR